MEYRNSEMKVDQLVNYLNEAKINLSPAFQRGHVWKPATRRKLVRNIVQGRPIPAIFLYKEASGSKYSYNILDGKQRLESLILFIGDERTDVRIPNWRHYFQSEALRKLGGFWVETAGGKKTTFAKLSDEEVRDLREYSIPTIEILLDDNSGLEEVITLFVDINQQGDPVDRFDIVKAMYRANPLLKSVFQLVAEEQRRQQDVFYRQKRNDFTRVLKRLQVVVKIQANNAAVDAMWERLLELALFARDGKHRSQIEVLNPFLKGKGETAARLTKGEESRLRKVFAFLNKLPESLKKSRFVTDQTHFYTLATTLLGHDLEQKFGVAGLRTRLQRVSQWMSNEASAPRGSARAQLRNYLEQSARQTTHVSRRTAREKLLLALLDRANEA